jgi:predicted Ser/Thr protein kinase
MGPGDFEPPEAKDLEKIFPDFEVKRLVGRGGMGAVYEAFQRDLERQVALKILPPETANDLEFQERFRREAATLAKLAHPNIVKLFDYGEREGYFYFIMEYVEGADLSALMSDGEFSPKEVLSIIGQVCDALDYSHELGVVHRDIKPGNILIGEDGVAKIVDFGLAKVEDPLDPGLTGTMSTMGTVQYMSPEQMSGLKNTDHRSDIYSLGVVLYELLTGKVPAGSFKSPSERRAGLGPRFDEVVLKALREDPEQRQQTATEVKAGLEEAVATPVPSSAAMTVRVVLAAIFASALVLGVFAFFLWDDDSGSDGERVIREVFEVTRIEADGREGAVIPVMEGGLATVSLSAAEEAFGVGINARGEVVAWGADRYGQASPPPGMIADRVSAGQGERNAHALALLPDGTVVGWGDDTFGQASPPVGLEGVVSIAGGETFSLSLTKEGKALSWGSPKLEMGEGLKEIVAGAKFAAGLEKDGTVVVWGDGTGKVDGKAIMLAAGNRHLLALREDGTVVAWGDNSRGQCAVPEGLPEMVAVFAGGNGSACVDEDGKGYFWGVAAEMSGREFETVRAVSIGNAEVLVIEGP